MSLFKTYCPKSLFVSTLKLTKCLFRRQPTLCVTDVTYLKSVLSLHNEIHLDMGDMFTIAADSDTQQELVVLNIHKSLAKMDSVLFGSSSEYEKTIEGCEKYTDHLSNKLNQSELCVIA